MEYVYNKHVLLYKISFFSMRPSYDKPPRSTPEFHPPQSPLSLSFPTSQCEQAMVVQFGADPRLRDGH